LTAKPHLTTKLTNKAANALLFVAYALAGTYAIAADQSLNNDVISTNKDLVIGKLATAFVLLAAISSSS